jgi:hypothetical protein
LRGVFLLPQPAYAPPQACTLAAACLPLSPAAVFLRECPMAKSQIRTTCDNSSDYKIEWLPKSVLGQPPPAPPDNPDGPASELSGDGVDAPRRSRKRRLN